MDLTPNEKVKEFFALSKSTNFERSKIVLGIVAQRFFCFHSDHRYTKISQTQQTATNLFFSYLNPTIFFLQIGFQYGLQSMRKRRVDVDFGEIFFYLH